jgi:hypothetical protein
LAAARVEGIRPTELPGKECRAVFVPAEGNLQMFDLIAVADGLNAFALPIFGIGSLLASRLATGPAARHAQQFFIAALALVTVATLRTVIECELTWLTHMMTLMVMIVGAVVVPSHRISSDTV